MIKSMTAYAKAEAVEDSITISAEIRTYNSRSLDTNIKLPHGYGQFEANIRKYLSEKFSRGRVEIRFVISDSSDESFKYTVNSAKASAYLDAARKLKNDVGVGGEVLLENLLNQSGIIVPAEVEIDAEKYWKVFQTCLDKAFEGLDSMRSVEGRNLQKDISDRLDFIESSVEFIEKNSNELFEIYHKRLKERVVALSQGVCDIDEARINQEAAILADKSDISEEIVRAKSHIIQFRAIMDAEEPGGRKINFLLQEFNREFNTMGSKSGNAEISIKVVEAKSELEKIREQIQNVE